MRNIARNFRDFAEKHPNLGAYICLAETVKSRGFSRKSLVKAFNELMPADEYLKSEAKGLVDYLEYLSKGLEEGEK